MNTELHDRLAEPFDPSEVKWLPGATSKDKTKALAMAYVDARAVMERLDAVFGPAGWSDDYEPLPNGSVVCRLTVTIDGQPVTKTDVGSKSEQPDQGDQMKAAFSDALKRAAVKLGIGRYLYRLPSEWCPFDGRKITQPPRLPEWAVPAGVKVPPPAPPKATAADRCKAIHRKLKAAGKAWSPALKFVGFETGDSFDEPASETAAAAMAEVLTAAQIAELEKALSKAKQPTAA